MCDVASISSQPPPWSPFPVLSARGDVRRLVGEGQRADVTRGSAGSSGCVGHGEDSQAQQLQIHPVKAQEVEVSPSISQERRANRQASGSVGGQG